MKLLLIIRCRSFLCICIYIGILCPKSTSNGLSNNDVWYYKIVTINKYGVKYEFYMILLPLKVNIKWPSNHSHRKQYCGICHIWFRYIVSLYYKVTKEHFIICTWVIKRNRTNNSHIFSTLVFPSFFFILYICNIKFIYNLL